MLLLFVPVFVALGVWQIDRAGQRREEARLVEGRSVLPPYSLSALEPDGEPLQHRRLLAEGEWEAAGQILIEGRRHAGRAGFHVVTPLRITGSDVRVLVSRGWIPALADGSPSPAGVPAGSVRVQGVGYIPAAPALALATPAHVPTWGGRWPYLTLDLVSATRDYPVQPVTILQDPNDPQGFVRDWPRAPSKEWMHIGYAIQWLAFAVISLVLALRLGRAPRTPSEDRP